MKSCDKCGNPIGNELIEMNNLKLEVAETISIFDLCNDCNKKLDAMVRKWVDGK